VNLSSVIVIALSFISTSVQASFENIWVEVSAGIMGHSVNLKAVDEDFNWAIGSFRYTEPAFTSFEDIDTGKTIDATVTTLGVTKNWTAIGNWGYLDAGVGFGVGKGTWVRDCEKGESSWLVSKWACESRRGYQAGIPFQVSAVFGTYTGIGITLNGFVTLDVTSVNLGVVIPFGDFTK